MKMLGVEWIVSASAVGSLQERYAPMDLVFPDQFIDRTRGRISTFFSSGTGWSVIIRSNLRAGYAAAYPSTQVSARTLEEAKGTQPPPVPGVPNEVNEARLRMSE